MYGFRKVMNYGRSGDYREEVEFQHAFFCKDKVELLANIKRRISTAKSVDPDVSISGKDILTNLSTLREKQKKMDTTLTKMKKENEVLWRELSTVRQRHKAQEQVLHKVIQFLVQIIQRSNQSIHVPRKLARMLQDNSVSQENSSQVARIVDALRNNDSDCIIVPDETSNTFGAVIHEVTDFDPEVANSPIAPAVAKFNTLKPFPEATKNSTLSISPNSSTISSSLEHLNILENLQNRGTHSLENESTKGEKTNGISMKYVAIPFQGDPNKLVLIPAENFTSQEISNLKADSFCNVIALPDKETDSDFSAVANSSPVPMNDINNDSLKHTSNASSNFQFSDTTAISSLSSLQSHFPGVSSKHKLSDLSLLKNDYDDSVLSDLLQASKISSIEEDCELKDTAEANYERKVKGSPMNEYSVDMQTSLESCNNQVAIPGPSSLVKSTKNCFPDFTVLQDPINSTSSNIDMKILEQLFSTDDVGNNESFINQLPADAVMTNPSEDIMGNEIVQFTPTVLDEDQFHWLDFLSHESFNGDSDLNGGFYCGPKDTDVLLESNEDIIFSSSLEALKKELMLTTPQRNPNKIVKKTKRRKVK